MGALRALGQGCTRSPFGEGRRLSREAPIPSVQGKGKSGSPETGTSAPLPPETAVGRRGAPPRGSECCWELRWAKALRSAGGAICSPPAAQRGSVQHPAALQGWEGAAQAEAHPFITRLRGFFPTSSLVA